MSFNLPDFVTHWPCERRHNPHEKQVAEAVYQWWEDLGFMSPKHVTAMRHTDAAMCASIACPDFTPEHLRVGVDDTLIFFLMDVVMEPATIEQALAMKEACMDAFRNPHKPRPKNGETIWAEICRKWWAMALPDVQEWLRPRMVRHFENWFDGTFAEVVNRERGTRPTTIEGYLFIRRSSIGCRAAWDITLLNLNIPESILDSPAVVEFAENTIDLGIFINDSVSYHLEEALGDVDNVVNIIKALYGMSLQEAMDHVEKLFKEKAEKVLRAVADDDFPPCPDERVKADMKAYKIGLRNWITAALYWSYEGKKYFPNDEYEDLRAMKTRKVYLLPKAVRKA